MVHKSHGNRLYIAANYCLYQELVTACKILFPNIDIRFFTVALLLHGLSEHSVPNFKLFIKLGKTRFWRKSPSTDKANAGMSQMQQLVQGLLCTVLKVRNNTIIFLMIRWGRYPMAIPLILNNSYWRRSFHAP